MVRKGPPDALWEDGDSNKGLGLLGKRGGCQIMMD